MSRVQVLSEEASLTLGLDASEVAEAQLRCTAPCEGVDSARWSSDFAFWAQRDALRIVLDGYALRRVVAGAHRAVEIVGPGHVITPAPTGEHLDYRVEARTLVEMRVAVLDRRFLQYAARWPEIGINIAAATANRAAALTAIAALTHEPKLERRLHVVLWHLAGRWGRVTARGIRLPFRLGQQDLADLVGARRPSVSTCMGRLRVGGLIVDDIDGTWLVRRPGVPADAGLVDDPGDASPEEAPDRREVAPAGALTLAA